MAHLGFFRLKWDSVVAAAAPSMAWLDSVVLLTSLKYICLFTHSGPESQGFYLIIFNNFVTLDRISRQIEFKI